MLAKLLITIGLASAGLLLVLLHVTTPATAGALGILAVFLLSYIVVMVVTTFIVFVGGKMIKIFIGSKYGYLKTEFTLKKAYYYSSIIALAPVIFMSLQSVGGIGVYEIVLVLLLVALGCLYIAKRSR